MQCTQYARHLLKKNQAKNLEKLSKLKLEIVQDYQPGNTVYF